MLKYDSSKDISQIVYIVIFSIVLAISWFCIEQCNPDRFVSMLVASAIGYLFFPICRLIRYVLIKE